MPWDVMGGEVQYEEPRTFSWWHSNGKEHPTTGEVCMAQPLSGRICNAVSYSTDSSFDTNMHTT